MAVSSVRVANPRVELGLPFVGVFHQILTFEIIAVCEYCCSCRESIRAVDGCRVNVVCFAFVDFHLGHSPVLLRQRIAVYTHRYHGVYTVSTPNRVDICSNHGAGSRIATTSSSSNGSCSAMASSMPVSPCQGQVANMERVTLANRDVTDTRPLRRHSPSRACAPALFGDVWGGPCQPHALPPTQLRHANPQQELCSQTAPALTNPHTHAPTSQTLNLSTTPHVT